MPILNRVKGSSLIKLQPPRTATYQKETPAQVISCEIYEMFKSALFYRVHLQWLFFKVSGFQPATLLKKRLRQRSFSVNSAKFLKTSFLLTEHFWMTASCVYLLILRSFSEHVLYRATPGNCYFMCKLQNFKTVKQYFTGTFYARSRSTHSKARLHLLKIPENCL